MLDYRYDERFFDGTADEDAVKRGEEREEVEEEGVRVGVEKVVAAALLE